MCMYTPIPTHIQTHTITHVHTHTYTHAGLAIAEYFRDQEGQDVLLFVDNIFRFTQAGSEVSALLGALVWCIS